MERINKAFLIVEPGDDLYGLTNLFCADYSGLDILNEVFNYLSEIKSDDEDYIAVYPGNNNLSYISIYKDVETTANLIKKFISDFQYENIITILISN